MSTPHHRRHLVLEGAFNMRDLSGVPTIDGYQVRSGRLFRADSLHALTNADLDTLDKYGIASVVDLRLDEEITTLGKARLIERGVRHIHMPVMSNEPVLLPGDTIPDNMGYLYAKIAMAFADRFVRVVEALATVENMPAVFHCAAGKDRTGMTAALIYSVLSVDREDIIADYVLTEANMDRILEIEKQNSPPRNADWIEYPASYNRAEDATIRTFLGALDEGFGSPVAWLESNGLPAGAIENLRSELLN